MGRKEMTLLSHPDQSLLSHVSGVCTFAKKVMQEGSDNDPLFKELVMTACVFHDFAKSTSYFQKYIKSTKKQKQKLSSHSLLSSIVGYYATKKLLEVRKIPILPDDALFVMLAIQRHHGDLRNLRTSLSWDEEDSKLLLKQAEAIEYPAWQEVYQGLLSFLPFELHEIELSADIVKAWILEWKREVRKLKRLPDISLRQYFRFCRLYSLLLDADKNQAALRERVFMERFMIPPNTVEHYKSHHNWSSSPLNILREQAFQEVTSNLQQKEGRIFTIHLPTGMGKTLLSLHAAMYLREKRRQETGITPRIIYALPFLSVIDQNFTVFEDVLQKMGLPTHHAMLLKHHSLMEPVFVSSTSQVEEDHQFGIRESQLLIEGWNSEIVCTTFVQLFQTLLNNRNRVLRRFHRFSPAIILIDEVQALPVKHWHLVRELLLELSKDSDILLLTATKPNLFVDSDPVVPLCNPKPYFQAVNRVKISYQAQKSNVKEYMEDVPIDKERSYLFIFNTINSAKEAYESLQDRLGETIGFLSTHIPPKERLKRIEAIRQGKYRVVVSTQLIEAGVDVSFDVVYRDLAPLDSIIQSFGRCNRHGHKEGEVHVISLWDSRCRLASYIYEPVKLDVTEQLLEKYQPEDESSLFDIIEDYFEIIKKKSKSEYKELIAGITQLYFSGDCEPGIRYPVNFFRLIEEDAKVEVFLELDSGAKDTWEKYIQLKQMNDLWERKAAFQAMKKDFYEYVVAVPDKRDILPAEVEGIRYVPQLDLSTYYHLETGFITKGVNAIW
jgi:CRISPR-associated endonuclease/helicase Cas3